ncbi:hypothetical protein [Pararhizobium haloflavum]|uniref:hypothetical protein n=1 Tax=Pararhizobium haloflavum TaxID=2037914 RepID=UPI000C19739E|nr:hypothetical protein [Pararhizobium haloflavum]
MRQTLKHQETRPESALREVLALVSAELGDIAAKVEELEPHIGRAGDASGMRKIQSIDLTVQRVRALCDFLSVLQKTVPDDLPVDVAAALGTVKLADVQRRLSGHGTTSPRLEAVGDCELF